MKKLMGRSTREERFDLLHLLLLEIGIVGYDGRKEFFPACVFLINDEMPPRSQLKLQAQSVAGETVLHESEDLRDIRPRRRTCRQLEPPAVCVRRETRVRRLDPIGWGFHPAA